jgi:hypothetical protein
MSLSICIQLINYNANDFQYELRNVKGQCWKGNTHQIIVTWLFKK